MPHVYPKSSVADDRPAPRPCRGLRPPRDAGHAGQGLGEPLGACPSRARHVASRQDRVVIPHGEPHGGNVMTMSSGLVLGDWDTVLLAPPERDLWDMADRDESALDHYARATGVQIDQDALSLYRLWYDLAEIGGYLALFPPPPRETTATA